MLAVLRLASGPHGCDARLLRAATGALAPSVSRCLRRLEVRGLVAVRGPLVRRPLPARRYARRITLTDAGRRCLAQFDRARVTIPINRTTASGNNVTVNPPAGNNEQITE
jgi:DNA-binding MarR family transcriptional regulator